MCLFLVGRVRGYNNIEGMIQGEVFLSMNHLFEESRTIPIICIYVLSLNYTSPYIIYTH